MYTVRLENLPGSYNNDDAYQCVLTYVYNKNLFGGYGFYPYTLDNIISQYALSEENSINASDRKIWHFIITFNNRHNMTELYDLANQIALQFAPHYQILFSVDTKNKTHLHFAVNAYPISSEALILDNATMKQYMYQIIQLLHHQYPTYKTTLQLNKEV